MNSESSNQSQSTYSFVELMDRYDIQIPLIQRDYVQGRSNDEGHELRRSFIPYLMGAFDGAIHLDFIYAEKVDGVAGGSKPVLIPLDGQQRLTTLLLLSWLMSRYHVEAKWVFDFSARRKVQAFLKQLISIESPLVADPEGKAFTKVSDYLRSQHWLFSAWSSDVNVRGMMTMLDELGAAIFKRKQDSDVFDGDQVLRNIQFELCDAKNIGADRIYIKMNARGKRLTDWENLKALIEGKIKQFHADGLKDWQGLIDGKWQDCCLKYVATDQSASDCANDDDKAQEWAKGVDALFLQVFYSVMCECVVRSSLDGDSVETELRLRQFNGGTASISVWGDVLDVIGQRQLMTFFVDQVNAAFTLLDKADFLIQWTTDRSKNVLWDKNYSMKGYAFDYMKMTYHRRVRFYILKAFDDVQCKRFLLNVLDATTVDSPETYKRFMAGLLSWGYDGVISVETIDKLQGVSESQKKEESRKLSYNEADICELERANPYFNGSLGFLFGPKEMSGGEVCLTELSRRLEDCFKECCFEQGGGKMKDGAFVALLGYAPEWNGDCEGCRGWNIWVPKDQQGWLYLLKDELVRAFLMNLYTRERVDAQWVKAYVEACEKNMNRNIRIVARWYDDAWHLYLYNASSFTNWSVRLDGVDTPQWRDSSPSSG